MSGNFDQPDIVGLSIDGGVGGLTTFRWLPLFQFSLGRFALDWTDLVLAESPVRGFISHWIGGLCMGQHGELLVPENILENDSVCYENFRKTK